MSDKGVALIVIGALLLGAAGFYLLYVRPGGGAPAPTTAPPTTEVPTTAPPQPTRRPKPSRSPKPTTTGPPETTSPPTQAQLDYASLWASLRPGAWAKYEMTMPQGPKSYMTVTVHGRETRRGVECIKVTYEIEVPTGQGQQTTKTTVTAWISVETGETVEVQVCLPGIGCQAASPQQAQQYEYVPPEGSPVVGTETITVPAGTFTCYKIVHGGATVWWSPDAPPLGVVKAEYSSGGELTLVALGP